MIVVAAIAALVILIAAFKSDPYKLTISLSLEIASFALVLMGGKGLILDVAAKVSNFELDLTYGGQMEATWEYVTIIAVMSVVAVVTIIMKGIIDYGRSLVKPQP